MKKTLGKWLFVGGFAGALLASAALYAVDMIASKAREGI